MAEKKRCPQLVQTDEGGLAIAIVEFDGVRPLVYWNLPILPKLDGGTREQILTKIDRFRERIAGQEPILYHEADHE